MKFSYFFLEILETLNGRKRAELQELHRNGMKPSQITKELNIGVASVYR